MKDVHMRLVDLIPDDNFTTALSIGEDVVRMVELEMCKASTIIVMGGGVKYCFSPLSFYLGIEKISDFPLRVNHGQQPIVVVDPILFVSRNKFDDFQFVDELLKYLNNMEQQPSFEVVVSISFDVVAPISSRLGCYIYLNISKAYQQIGGHQIARRNKQYELNYVYWLLAMGYSQRKIRNFLYPLKKDGGGKLIPNP